MEKKASPFNLGMGKYWMAGATIEGLMDWGAMMGLSASSWVSPTDINCLSSSVFLFFLTEINRNPQVASLPASRLD